MDFSQPETSVDLGGLVRTITESVCTNEHQRELDAALPRFDRALWETLIEADILSAAAPESVGGGGFGVLEQAAVLEALGRQLAAVPYLESAVLAAGALAKFGSAALQQDWASPAVAGSKILTVALSGDVGEGPVRAAATADGHTLTGARTQVSYGTVAFGHHGIPGDARRSGHHRHPAAHHRPRQRGTSGIDRGTGRR